ncbi:DUF6297 family protein [Microbacterium sp. H1-D42]|uniref:DUF6297 family protein n=1 Tax=Microbacterium sp. H1-D42 TaxID=2925844 RepID=UPI001F52EC71|nr:DUF6297 family protein [Microbacterium sp. H1-D42]UNK69297.1 DUF6297 family protein [Microbacterium sp. H1-D42]
MSATTQAALKVWRARSTRSVADRGYVVYLGLLVTLVTVVPVARMVWLSASGVDGSALLGSASAPGVATLMSAALWAGALLVGRDRGPAVLPPFLTHALAASSVPRADAFLGPLLRGGVLVTAISTAITAVVSLSLAANGVVDAFGVTGFIVTGAMVGVITTVAWLSGQAVPSAAIPAAIGIVLLGSITAGLPALQPFTPWGWVGATYPGGGSLTAVGALAALTVALVSVVPTLLNRLGYRRLIAQASRWESATMHATSMDFNTAAATYQARPNWGRGTRAVRQSRGLARTFWIRDAVGATRTPGRIVVGLLALIAAGVLLTFAFADSTPGWLLGAAAGVTLFAGLGPFSDGLRHAARVAADLPLYGISDESLLAHHLLFPVTVILAVLLATVLVCAIASGSGVGPPLAAALLLGLHAVLARTSSALKGPLPPVLLTPIPTPMGDAGAAVRMVWAVDAPVVMAIAGVSAVFLFPAPLLVVGVTAALIGLCVSRWRRR